jgi:hypothetical protein
MSPASTTVATMTASNMPLAGHTITNLEPIDFLPHTNHFADVFVPDNHRHRYGAL